MELTLVALARLAIALATACLFAVKRDYFKDIKEAKCDVFWGRTGIPGKNRRTMGPDI